ncbi:glycosyltransferase [Oceanimonas sp. MB9]|uniref:glycosyltransferase family 4 protein n=1 Tax=Oceanimonas sp. MB9 TaxID=2588453 RepID=UPI0013F69992|nr:glycosyltransferase [Oceanimonas sp. MB9]NHI01399.1 putative glycosyltransferase EpsF [Oceanimonas sp. MB9]
MSGKIVLHVITGLEDGGAESVLYRLCTADVTHRHVVVSLMGEGKYGPLLKEAGIDVYCLNLPSGRIKIGALFKYIRMIKEIKPDIVQTWMYHADLIGGVCARLAGVRNVSWNIRHSELETGKSRKSTIVVARLCALVSYFVPSKIICCATKAKEVHENIGYDRSKMVIVENGYNLNSLKPDDCLRNNFRVELGIDDGELLLGMVGRFNIQKNHHGLLQSLSFVKASGLHFKCVLIGSGMDDENAELANWICQTGLQNEVLLLGQRTDIPAVMNALDIHLLSSSFGEGFPNVLAEAMACGTPCVTTDVGDAAIIVGNTGWVSPTNDSADFSNKVIQAVNEMRNNPECFEKRKIGAIERIHHNFSLRAMLDKYHKVW